MPVILCQNLTIRCPHRKWVAFLDNLFLTVDVAHILLTFDVRVMGTTRKSSAGFPEDFQDIKNINEALLYDGTLSRRCGFTLCFAWQDNILFLVSQQHSRFIDLSKTSFYVSGSGQRSPPLTQPSPGKFSRTMSRHSLAPSDKLADHVINIAVHLYSDIRHV